jgi:SAM-dependent methyltransferase
MSKRDPAAATGPKFVDVKELISEYDVAEHIRRSEVYYKDFTSSHWQFRKPFMGFEAAQLTTRLGVVLSNLDFFLEANVLDFGAGTAWLSRALALMGGNAVALDVSPSTLRLAESYNKAKYPEFADRISYLLFDGTTIDLPSDSIDRIVCFDTFHHVPNQDQVLSEFYRVLMPGGRAVFCEPGPTHSMSAMSQREMREFGVIENDVVIEDVWRRAQSVGFDNIEISVFMPRPTLCSIEEFQELREYDTADRVLRRVYESSFKEIYEGERLFVLFKGAGIQDSRTQEGLKGTITAEIKDLGKFYEIHGTVTNTGTATWRRSGTVPGSVNIGVILRQPDGTWDQDFDRIYFLEDPAPAGSTREFRIELAKDRIGEAQIHLDLVSEMVAWFAYLSESSVRLK